MIMRKRKLSPYRGEVPRMNETISHTIRKIDNGFIHETSHTAPDGTFNHKETYHPTKPTLAVPSAPVKAKRAPAKFTIKRKRAK